MATSIHLLFENFRYWIQQTTATNTKVRNKFESYDPFRVQPESSTGWLRKFYIDWQSSNEDIGATDMTAREAWHLFNVKLVYPARLPQLDMMQLITQDRHDILKTLRDPDKRFGYDASHTTTDVNLMNRIRTGDQLSLNNDAEIFDLTIQYKCLIRELEI